MALGNSLVKLERVTEFLPSRHVLWVVKDNLCLEHSHADGHEEKLLAHAEQRGLLHGSALQYTFTDGMEQDVRCGIEEDSQAVSLKVWHESRSPLTASLNWRMYNSSPPRLQYQYS